MAQPFIQSSFAGGELAPQMWGRVDLARYHSGCAVLRNFFVDYRGGVSTRAGTSFVGPGPQPSGAIRLLPFIFSSTQSYILELSDQLIRFIFQGAYVTETAFSVAGAFNGFPFTITVPGNDFVVGDQIFCEGFVGLDRPNGINALNGRTLVVGAVVSSTITLYDPISGLYLDGTTWTQFLGTGQVARIYAITSPYMAADLFALKFTQSADVLDITGTNYQPAQLKRLGPASWALDVIQFGTTTPAPTNLTVQPVGPQSGSTLRYNYCVTALSSSSTGQQESLPSFFAGTPNSALNQNTGVANILTWSAGANDVGYRIYKAVPVLNGTAGAPPFFVGYIGTSKAPNFHDTNFEPDFTQVPPEAQNPFQLGPIESLTIAEAGFGYIDPQVTITDPTGTGATATATADTAGNGAITSVDLTDGGTNYSSPTVTIVEGSPAPGTGLVLAFSGTWVGSGNGPYVPDVGSITVSSGGTHYHSPIIYLSCDISNNVVGFSQGIQVGTTTGAVVTALIPEVDLTVNTDDGSPPANTVLFTIVDNKNLPDYGTAVVTAQVTGLNNPAVVSYFDQRKVFAGSVKNPDTFWMSQIGLYNNFDTSFPSQSGDALTGTIVSSEVNIIGSVTPVAGGLLCLTSSGAYLVNGGTTGAALTPQSITAQTQAFSGADPLQPVRVNYDVIYFSARGSAVRDITFNFYFSVYTGEDISAQSAHLFYGRRIVQWAYAEEPFKIIWCVRDDGIALSLTIMKEQQITGWGRHDTCGNFISVMSIPEGNEDAVYFAVSRWFNGQYINVVERQASRLFGANPGANIPSNPEEAWSLDCANVLLPTPAEIDILYGLLTGPAVLAEAIIMQGGSGYGVTPYCQVTDLKGTGQGGQVSVTLTGGVITGVSIDAVGFGYQQPEIEIIDPTGQGRGGVISIGVNVLWTFFTDASPGGSPPSSPAIVGQIIRAGGGIGVVVEADVGGTTIIANMFNGPFALLPSAPGQAIMQPQAAGTWSLSTPVTVIGGLDQFDGCIVGIVADGNVLAPQMVVDGCLTLPQPATYVLAGALFGAQVQTLPFNVGDQPTIQGRRKEVPAVTLKAMDTRGIRLGATWETLVDQKERTNEPMQLCTQFTRTAGWQLASYQNGPLQPIPAEYLDVRTVLDSIWQDQGYVCLQQDYPMPCTLLAEMPEENTGDMPG